MDEPHIIPLFSKVFYIKNLNIDSKKIVSLIDKDFGKIDSDFGNAASSTDSKQVLEKKKFKFSKKQVMEEFNFFTKEVLKYENKFKMSTSWFTKTNKNQQSNYHCHSNCMMSGILYIQVDENSGDINFTDYSMTRFLLNPKEPNLYNSRSWRFKPENGMVIFFPSEVYHKILESHSSIERYSLAFNFIPIGDIYAKQSDSYLYLK